jgi:DNA-binding SARP family transcriptional activator
VANRSEPRRGRLVDIVGSMLTALLVFGAVPAVLVTLVGNPLSGGLGHHWDHGVRVALTVLTVVAWVAWVACCAQLIRAVVHHVRRGHVSPATVATLTDRIAGRIAVGILAVTTLGAPLVVAGTASGASTTVVAPMPAASPAAGGVTVVTPRASAPAAYVVRVGDSLWTIAESHLGDGGDWTEIAALNLGRTMSDGRRFIDPSLIYPGWSLVMPASIGPTSPTAEVLPVVSPSAPSPATNPPSAVPTPALTIPATPPTSPSSPTTPTTLPATATTEPTTATTVPATPAGIAPHRRASSLPELAALGIGAIACAALGRRSRRRRLLQRATLEHPSTRPEPSEGAVSTDVLLQRFHDVPVLAAFERANCWLRGALDASPPGTSDSIRAICVTSFGVDFWLARPGLGSPPGLDLVEGGQVWHLPHSELDEVSLDQPCFPIVLPIGDDDEGTWLIPLRPGTCLPLVGSGTRQLWDAARRVQESWAWADSVVVTDDAAVAESEARRTSGAVGLARDFPVLYFGDPAGLTPEILSRLCVVTEAAGAATDLSILIDRQGASIHPLARTVRPHLITEDAARLIDELIEPAGLDSSRRNDEPMVTESDRPDESANEAALGVTELGPGSVEVRLLTMTPRLDGLQEELPANRERRAVELVAYLALHRPDAVTSDRLRTRVLGSGDADAAAKTLFNTATAARRAMGSDDQGVPLFPAGTRTGHYRVSDAVTVDVHRAAALAAAGSAADEADMAIALLRAALDLIEGEPMANVLSGYTWWESEGHGGRVAAVLVNAACNLAALAVEAGLFDVAQWGLERARLVDPYSESLSRAAMQVAAAAGDADRLRREWRECQRRMDELDPGSTPSPRTERLYGELAQQVLAS